jgi:hypothetical protein
MNLCETMQKMVDGTAISVAMGPDLPEMRRRRYTEMIAETVDRAAWRPSAERSG